jgi:hypothetical protein
MLLRREVDLALERKMTNRTVFFVTGCARSGTTSLCRILDEASNGVCLMEPDPKLNAESRDVIEGRLKNHDVVIDLIRPRVQTSLSAGVIHGEKNLTLVPLIPLLNDAFDCKFVFVIRDGREVVRSLIDWHNRMFGNIYRECEDVGELSNRALQNVADLPIELDAADYSRPRPLKGDPFYEEWMSLSRLEMCAWYWSFINNLAMKNLADIPRANWISLDYTSPSVKSIIEVADFLGLDGVKKDTVVDMLQRKINSLMDRIGEEEFYPHWEDWSEERKRSFNRIAEKTMVLLGYYPS